MSLYRADRLRTHFSDLLPFNYSRGLSQDETILLSWKISSPYLNANWGQNDEGYRRSGPCSWPRVGCGDWFGEERVTVLDLASVNLTGPVPAQISGLSALTVLSFASNSLTGSIPSDIGNCINLKVLQIQHTLVQSVRWVVSVFTRLCFEFESGCEQVLWNSFLQERSWFDS